MPSQPGKPSQVEGSIAIAHAIAACRPEVICAYPITPQTHIVEALARMARLEQLGNCQYVNVESEFAALSVCIGASASGSRAYTATSSQGLLFMAEAVYNTSGMRLPVVMTIGNRAIGGPINIWNDQSDSMALRDAGWIQLHAENNQEAADLHIQAFRLAEQVNLPVMVCVDGFLLTHAFEQITLTDQEKTDAFLPPFEPIQALNIEEPMSIGAMVGPEAFMEVRYLNASQFDESLEPIQSISEEFAALFGRSSGGLFEHYHSEAAQTVVIALGSVNGTIKDVVDNLRDEGASIGSIKISAYRPFPAAQLREALSQAERVIVVEKSFFSGIGGPLFNDVVRSLENSGIAHYSVIGGLGGRAILKKSLIEIFRNGMEESLEPLSFIDLDQKVITRELLRQRAGSHGK
ncbi:MAG: pyruvate ferredoxin oxidoreductase [Gammaproteobacteria bacterium]|nr:MAG: pyruvate ferredoxin oxidoreductase [Gammaproteobacteria bacterium]RLA15494.1 MAG: pyruvate ferredoxin oxidoreductase [Gammaproteobacteria bacterium]